MVVFHVFLNGTKICTAGVGEDGVLGTVITWSRNIDESPLVDFDPIQLRVGGLMRREDGSSLFPYWVDVDLEVGDTVDVEIADMQTADDPIWPTTYDELDEENEEMTKSWIRERCQRWGWALKEKL